VYGAVSAAGEWGLKKNCAVAYADKGSGNGAQELATNTITLINGLTQNAATAGNASLFSAQISDAERNAFNASNPFRYAYKHAHSQQNPEKDWGKFTLQAIEFALWAINEQYSLPSGTPGVKERLITPAKTTVIAASVSNGGGAALAAAEQDVDGLINGVVVGEPQINTNVPAALKITRGGTPVASFGRPLYDYVTIANLYQPCAAYAPANAASPLLATVSQASAQARCAALAGAGLVQGADFASQATSALAQLQQAGWESESNLLHASHFGLQATPGVAVTYANAYGRARVLDNLCAFSFATTSALGQPAAPAASPMVNLFGTGNGVPPTNGINVIYNTPANGVPINHLLADGNFAFNGAQCLRQLWTGTSAQAQAVQTGVSQVKVNASLRGKPAIIVQGRSDALVPVNHASRTYFGANKMAEGTASRLSYIEVLNAQHFDAFLGQAGYDTRFLPVHYYNIQALNMMWNTLKANAALPPSQVVRTTPRGGTAGAAPPISVAANLPPISLAPAATDQILFDSATSTVRVPN
jgi:hydroxybutyrate-dimer hydrolase